MHRVDMRPDQVLKELKALKLTIKDKLAWLQSPESRNVMDAESRANLAILYARRVMALKYVIHAMEEEAQRPHLTVSRAA